MAAMLSEAAIMLIAMVVAARWVIRRFHVPRTLPAMISMGLIAIGLLFPAEIAGVLLVRGLSVQEYLAGFTTAPGIISLVMFLLFAAMPTLVTRVGSVSRPNDTAEAEDL
jgi:endonuclease/exonuclease/phosphatase (EEP) superfamily protein YafD